MSKAPLVLMSRDGDVAVITLNRPEARNAVSATLGDELVQALGDAQDAGAIVLAATDPAFCAGLDLAEVRAGRMPPTSFIGAVHDARPPVIGAVNGPAIAAGFDLALACDLLVGSERASFADTHVRIGLPPPVRLVEGLCDRVGRAFALEMMLTGRTVDAPTALRVGLLNSVVPHEDLMTEALGIARTIAAGDRNVVERIMVSVRNRDALNR